jgi:hypothetical protein
MKDHTVRSFALSVTLWVQDQGIVDLDSCICAKVFELPHNKLGSVVGDYVIGEAESVHDLMNEFYCLGYCYGSRWLCFDPFSELVQMCVNPPFPFFEWTYHIQSPCGKGSTNRYGM